jgi:hypothetical protein
MAGPVTSVIESEENYFGSKLSVKHKKMPLDLQFRELYAIFKQ